MKIGMNIKKRNYGILFLMLSVFLIMIFLPQMQVMANEPVIVVIDPGHGGENLGAEYDGYTEKKMTMVVARAMKEELEKYENIVVYLTHETDIDMSLRERAEFAKNKQADFLFSLHFNASVKHNLFGSEVWIPAYGDYYVKGYQFGQIQMQEFENMGLYLRGIKTKLNDKGTDYYGILRQCTDLEIPSALIEHCHMDQDNDKPFYQQGEEQWKAFGRMDAQAVAKYFGLKSKEKDIDYSNYPKEALIPSKEAVIPDKTPPEVSEIEVIAIEEATPELTVHIKASDSDSYIQYYKYSLDGGITYSELQKWPRPVWNQSEPDLTCKIPAIFNREIDLRICVYNGFDGFTESNCVTIEPIASYKESVQESVTQKEYREITYELTEMESNRDTHTPSLTGMILLIILIVLIMLILLLLVIRMLFLLKPHSKGKKKR